MIKVRIYWAYPYSRWCAEEWQGLFRIFLGHLWFVIGKRATFRQNFRRSARIGQRLYQMERRYQVRARQ